MDRVISKVFFDIGDLVDELFDVRSELDSCGYVYGDIDVSVVVGEEFVADPTSCESDYEGFCLVGFTWPHAGC
jgi:hypothetical protein